MENINDDQLYNQIRRGNEVKDLAQDPGFILIMESLKTDAEEATMKLKEVDPEDSKKIRELQNIIWRYDEIAARMYTLISMGMEAAEELQDKGEMS